MNCVKNELDYYYTKSVNPLNEFLKDLEKQKSKYKKNSALTEIYENSINNIKIRIGNKNSETKKYKTVNDKIIKNELTKIKSEAQENLLLENLIANEKFRMVESYQSLIIDLFIIKNNKINIYNVKKNYVDNKKERKRYEQMIITLEEEEKFLLEYRTEINFQQINEVKIRKYFINKFNKLM